MSDLIRRKDARLIALEYIGDSMERHGALEAIRHLPAVQPDALHRSFPEAGDGRPFPPMMNELMTAGLVAEDARFVAIQLAQNGYSLAKITHVNETPKREHENADMLKLSVQGKAREAALREAAAACIWDDGDASRAAILALIDKPAHD